MSLIRIIVISLLALLPLSCLGEVLHNIEYLNTLGSIRQKYPNAKITRVKAAWVTEGQDFFRLEGEGFPGVLFIAFNDLRPYWRKESAKENKDSVTPGTPESEWSLHARSMAGQSDDEALFVDWVRWVPGEPIPIQRYKSKYGEPSKCDFTADSMKPICEWSSRGLLVNLSDDQNMVLSAEASFTRTEMKAAWLKRGTFIPDWLKDEPELASAPRKEVKKDAKKAGDKKP